MSRAEWKAWYLRIYELSHVREMPFNIDDMREIAKYANAPNKRVLVLLRRRLETLNDFIRARLSTGVFPPPGERQKFLKKEVLERAKALLDALDEKEVHAVTFEPFIETPKTKIDYFQLSENLSDLVDWTQEAIDILEREKGPRRKIETDLKEFLVRELLKFFVALSKTNKPTRNPVDIGEKNYFEASRFTAFVKSCSRPIFGRDVSLDGYIKAAIKNMEKSL